MLQQSVKQELPLRLAFALGCVAFIGGAVVLLGWILGAERLKDWVGDGIAMKGNAGVLVMAVGGGLMALSSRRGERADWRALLAAALGALAASIGGLTLLEHLTGWNLGIDTLLFDETPGARATAAPGRMGPPASASMLFIGTGLIIAVATLGRAGAERRVSARSLVPALAIATFCVALVSICGRLFHAEMLYTVPKLTGISLQMALLIVAAATGLVFAVPDREPVRTIAESGPAGTIARRALPLIVVLPILLGWIRTKGEEAALFDAGMGRTFLILSLISCLCGLLWWAISGIRSGARELRRTHDRRDQELSKMRMLHAIGTKLASAEQDGDQMLELIDAAIAISDADMGNIQLLEGDALEIVASRGFERPFLDHFAKVVCEGSACGATMKSGERTIVDDVETSPVFAESPAREIMLAAGARAVQSTPITSERGEMIGVFSTHYRRPTKPSENDLRMLDLLARIMGQWFERSRLEKERRQAEAVRSRLAAIVESSDDAVISKDLDGVITSWNAGATKLFGYSEREAVGKPITMLMAPDRHDEERSIIDRIRRGERVDHYETIRRRKDGTLIDISLTVSPLRDASGNVVGASKIAHDITERKRAEETLRDSEAQAKERLFSLLEERTAELRDSMNRLHDAQRLLALGNLAAGVGHDIANMVLPIRARLEPLAQMINSEEARRDIEAIGQSLTHLTSLSAGLRLMALDPSRNAASTEATDLELWWQEAEGVMRASLPRHVRLDAAIQKGIGVLMPRHQLTQAVFNLVRNAGEALAATADGLVRVEATAVSDGDSPRVAIAVSDNGHGLTAEALARCFEPYFSTKGRTIATGMGLAMVRGLVESAGGTVSVRSEPGTGATFTLVVPSGMPKQRPEHLSRNAMRTAAVSVPDVRTAALAAMMLEGLDLSVSRYDPSTNGSVPDADLWIVHEPDREKLWAFIARDSGRRAVVIGGASSQEDLGTMSAGFPDGRVSVVPSTAPPSALRDALSAALQTSPPNQAADGVGRS